MGKELIKPEGHIEWQGEECYILTVEEAEEMGKHIEIALSKREIGHLLQGKAVTLLYLDKGYEMQGMIDIKMSDDKTFFKVPEWKEGKEKIIL